MTSLKNQGTLLVFEGTPKRNVSFSRVLYLRKDCACRDVLVSQWVFHALISTSLPGAPPPPGALPATGGFATETPPRVAETR